MKPTTRLLGLNPTQFAKKTRQSTDWIDAKTRVLEEYRQWIRAAPEIQKQYSLPKRVAEIRTRVRQEFERHRYVNKLHIVDRLIAKSHIDFQETMNYWRQMTHVMSYFQDENFRGDKRLPSSFIEGFLEGRH